VNPAGGRPGAVTTVTVLAWRRSSDRNTSGSTGAGAVVAGSVVRVIVLLR
jgi:hypothetical protein